MTYDWTVLAEKGVLKRLSLVMKPIFGANHRWAMARGEESLRLEIARRRAAGDPIVSAAIADPPGPTFPHNLRRRTERGSRREEMTAAPARTPRSLRSR